MENDYRICTKTVMDNIADPDIRFDENGVCNYYHDYLTKIKIRVPEPERASGQLDKIITEIKSKKSNKTYDCIIGVSGGVDSTYVAYIVKKMGLNPLAVHVDNGWNSELAVKNIQNTLEKLNIDLYTEVLDWPTFRDIQVSFLKAGTPDVEIPTDHIVWSALYKIANRYKIKYIISGMNFRTEGILPPSWSRGYFDWKYLSGVQRKFGKKDISKMPHMSLTDLFKVNLVNKIKMVGILNYMPFNKAEALKIMMDELDYRPYEGKHHESIYTKFVQTIYLPQKFNIDKRKAHLSCAILQNDLTREAALAILQKPQITEQEQEDTIQYVRKKLNIDEETWQQIFNNPVKSIFDYPNTHRFELKLRKTINKLRAKNLLQN